MYHSWNLRKLLRYIAFDMALVLAAILLTRAGRQHFAAVDSAGGVSLPVLMYHSIAPVPETQYCISPETLESDLQYLQEHHYTAVSPEELIAYTEGTGDLPEKPVLLTFDDGLYNNLSLALPLLEKYDMCAVISVVGSFADVYAPDAPHNDIYSYLTWEDMQQLEDSGRITLGSHTYDMHENAPAGAVPKWNRKRRKPITKHCIQIFPCCKRNFRKIYTYSLQCLPIPMDLSVRRVNWCWKNWAFRLR